MCVCLVAQSRQRSGCFDMERCDCAVQWGTKSEVRSLGGNARGFAMEGGAVVGNAKSVKVHLYENEMIRKSKRY